jgi:hypothetical protein
MDIGTENPRVGCSILALTRSIPGKWVTVKSRDMEAAVCPDFDGTKIQGSEKTIAKP